MKQRLITQLLNASSFTDWLLSKTDSPTWEWGASGTFLFWAKFWDMKMFLSRCLIHPVRWHKVVSWLTERRRGRWRRVRGHRTRIGYRSWTVLWTTVTRKWTSMAIWGWETWRKSGIKKCVDTKDTNGFLSSPKRTWQILDLLNHVSRKSTREFECSALTVFVTLMPKQ